MGRALGLSLVAVVVVGAGALATGCGPPPACPNVESGLRDVAEARDLVIGTAYRQAFAGEDACYGHTATAEFNSLTPEIATFSNRVAAREGTYDFSEADVICDEAESRDMRCQVHALIWDPVDHPEWGIIPAWIRAQPAEQRRTTMVDLVTAVSAHYAGRAESNTLVNEAFDGAGNLTPSVWNTTGDDTYIFDAYRAARRADPGAKLFYNDWGAEDINPKSDAILDLAGRLHAETVEVEVDGTLRHLPLIDGIGMQMHVGTGPGQAPDPASVAANMRRIGEAGLLVRITELDVRIPVDEDGTATEADLDLQRQMYERFVQVCLDAANCDGITLWGFTDAHSWITENPGSFPGQGAAHPLDSRYRRKPAYTAILDALS